MNALWEATGISQSGKSTVTGFTAETDAEGHIRIIATILFDNAGQQNRLAKYHFTQSELEDASSDPATRYINGETENSQLQRLKTASENARELGSECAGDVMFGEYLHAFEDTYGHRKADNTPIAVNNGWGHAMQLHSPDHTYNEDFRARDPETGDYLGGANWKYNEARTLEMEHQVFDRMTALSGEKTNAHGWDDFKAFLEKFNATQEDSGDTHHFDSTNKHTKKIDLMNTELRRLGYTEFVGMDGTPKALDLKKDRQGRYIQKQGADNRKDFLRYKEDTTDSNGVVHKKGDLFKDTDKNFDGTILP